MGLREEEREKELRFFGCDLLRVFDDFVGFEKMGLWVYEFVFELYFLGFFCVCFLRKFIGLWVCSRLVIQLWAL